MSHEIRTPLTAILGFADTLGRLLGALNPISFQRCFEAWIQSVALLPEGNQTNQIAIGGKVLRRSHDRRNGRGPRWLISIVRKINVETRSGRGNEFLAFGLVASSTTTLIFRTILSAWAVDRSIRLGLLANDEKSNEITAIH